jgi:hypothetical protein
VAVPIPALVLDPLGLPALPDSLLDAAVGPLPLPAHAETAGATYEADSCGEARLYPAPCQAPPYPAMTLDSGDGLVQAFVFNVYASQVCGTFGHSAAEAERRVRARFQVAEARAVERAFWGAVAGTDGIDDVVGQISPVALAASANTIEAVSLLEQQMATVYGGQAIIHARPRMAAYMAKNYLVEPGANPPMTAAGNRVVFGRGYGGIGPANEAVGATTEYMFATGRVIIWRNDLFVSPPDQLLDRTLNQRGLYAIRTYAIAVECGAASTLVTRG